MYHNILCFKLKTSCISILFDILGLIFWNIFTNINYLHEKSNISRKTHVKRKYCQIGVKLTQKREIYQNIVRQISEKTITIQSIWRTWGIQKLEINSAAGWLELCENLQKVRFSEKKNPLVSKKKILHRARKNFRLRTIFLYKFIPSSFMEK